MDCYTGSIHGLGWVSWVGLGRDVEISDGGVGSNTMGHLTQSVSADDVYKLNIPFQCIKSDFPSFHISQFSSG